MAEDSEYTQIDAELVKYFFYRKEIKTRITPFTFAKAKLAGTVSEVVPANGSISETTSAHGIYCYICHLRVEMNKQSFAKSCADHLKTHTKDIQYILRKHMVWSKYTFGDMFNNNRDNTEGLCKHIEDEVNEIRANPEDPYEPIDVIILAFDLIWRMGYSIDDFLTKLNEKIDININRKWNFPNKYGVPIEHQRSR